MRYNTIHNRYHHFEVVNEQESSPAHFLYQFDTIPRYMAKRRERDWKDQRNRRSEDILSDFDDDDTDLVEDEPIKRKQRADDDLSDIPPVKSNNPDLNGRLRLFRSLHHDRVVIKLDKEQPEVIMAANYVEIEPNSRVLILSAGEGYIGCALALLHPDSSFLLHDSNLQNAQLSRRNVEANYEQIKNAEVISQEELEHLLQTNDIDVVILQPPGFTSLPVIEDAIKIGFKVLTIGGKLFMITNKKVGGERHLALANSVFNQESEIVGKGMEGFRVAHVAKSSESLHDAETEVLNAINFSIFDREFTLEAALSLFSTEDLDVGTRFLLESVNLDTFERLLDVGCGWGAIGIIGISVNENGTAVLMDIDTRAVATAKRNVELAQLQDRVEVFATDNLESIDGQFDLILSNPPFHADYTTLVNLFKGIRKKLEKGGKLFIVVEQSFLIKFEDILTDVFGGYTIQAENSDQTFSILMVRK